MLNEARRVRMEEMAGPVDEFISLQTMDWARRQLGIKTGKSKKAPAKKKAGFRRMPTPDEIAAWKKQSKAHHARVRKRREAGDFK